MFYFATSGVDESRHGTDKITVRRKLPINLEPEDLELYADDVETVIPEARVEAIENVRINPNGVLFYKNRILLESFSHPGNFQRWKTRSVLRAYAENFVRVSATGIHDVLWPIDDWSGGYYHWLADVLPKLIIASKAGGQMVLPSAFEKFGFVESSLHLLGHENFRFMGEKEFVQCDRLHIPVHTYFSHDFNEQVMRELRDRLRGTISKTQDCGTKMVYISRRNARKRRIVNEEELVPLLEELGFQITETENISFMEQLKLFSGATHLVSIHGAGLTNMLFMQPGSRVLELRLRDKRGTNCFFNLASALEHDFYYQFCEPEKPGSHPHEADLIVDAEKFRKTLGQFVNRWSG